MVARSSGLNSPETTETLTPTFSKHAAMHQADRAAALEPRPGPGRADEAAGGPVGEDTARILDGFEGRTYTIP